MKQQAFAHYLLYRAIRIGSVIRPKECSECGVNPGVGRDGRALIYGHHEDYSKPLDVLWLCGNCHRGKHTRSRVSLVKRGQTVHKPIRAYFLTRALQNATLNDMRKPELTWRVVCELASLCGAAPGLTRTWRFRHTVPARWQLRLIAKAKKARMGSFSGEDFDRLHEQLKIAIEKDRAIRKEAARVEIQL